MPRTRSVPRALLAGVAVVMSVAGARLPASAQDTSAVSRPPATIVHGTVRARFEGRLRLLEDAEVQAWTSEGSYTVHSGRDGRYLLRGLPPGPARMRVSLFGHRPLELTVRVPVRGALELDVELSATPFVLPEVRVDADGARTAAVATAVDGPGPPPDPVFEMRTLELSPGVIESGVLEAVAGMPGNDPADPSDVLFMRGSTTDMKLVLLDGMPVYAPFHVGGLLRSFEPSMLASADFHVGGAPARYDGGLTHVLDLRTRTARRDRSRGSATLDLLSTSVAVEQPLGRGAGALISARSLHDAGTAALGGGRGPYGYGDVLATLDADVGRSGSLRATGFWNRESVVLDYPGGPDDAAWGNRALTGSWTGRVGGAEVHALIGASRYDARLPLRPTPTPDDPEPSEILASADSERERILVEAAWRDGGTPLRVGLSFEDQRVDYAADRADGSSRLRRAAARSVAAGYADVTRTVTDGVTFRGGLRADVFEGDMPRLAPRASFAFELGPTSVLTVTGGRYHQMTRLPLDAGVDLTLEQFADVGLAASLPVASADHVVLTLDQRPRETVSLGLGGYFKRFTGVDARGGTLQNSGIDLQVVGIAERGAAWLGYGLSWFWSDTGVGGSTDDFTGRHVLTAGVSGRLAGPLRMETRFSYGGGLPSTGIPFSSSDEQLNSGAPAEPGGETLSGGPTLESRAGVPEFLLDESFLRLDVELHTRIERDWMGRSWRIRPYLRLLNALDRRDALFYTYQPWRSEEITPLAVRPVLPVFGVSVAF